MNNPTPSQDWIDNIITALRAGNDPDTGNLHITEAAAKKLITHRMNLERIDELKRLKKIDAFNEAYSSDPRPSRLVDIRISELEGESKKGGNDGS